MIGLLKSHGPANSRRSLLFPWGCEDRVTGMERNCQRPHHAFSSTSRRLRASFTSSSQRELVRKTLLARHLCRAQSAESSSLGHEIAAEIAEQSVAAVVPARVEWQRSAQCAKDDGDRQLIRMPRIDLAHVQVNGDGIERRRGLRVGDRRLCGARRRGPSAYLWVPAAVRPGAP